VDAVSSVSPQAAAAVVRTAKVAVASRARDRITGSSWRRDESDMLLVCRADRPHRFDPDAARAAVARANRLRSGLVHDKRGYERA